jgi:putative transcriptional regulator
MVVNLGYDTFVRLRIEHGPGAAMTSLQGHLLIASPHLRDPNFARSVVLLIQHNEDGALGVILNRPVEATIEEVWSQVSEEPCNAEGHLHEGGPCPGPLMVAHMDASCSQINICEGIYFSTDRQSIEQLVAKSSEPMKFFINYAGWGPGQLEGEIESGGWTTTPAGRDEIFRSDEELWSEVLRLAGRRSRLKGVDPKLIPDDPSVN